MRESSIMEHLGGLTSTREDYSLRNADFLISLARPAASAAMLVMVPSIRAQTNSPSSRSAFSRQVKSQYAFAVLQWWPFRVILWVILAIAATRFCLIMIDSTWWWVFGCSINGRHVVGDACSWSIPPIRGAYGDAEMQFLLFFVIAKPVDTAISGALGLVSRYLDGRPG